MLFCIRYGPSRVFTSRSASPSSRATSNIDVRVPQVQLRCRRRARCCSSDVERVLRDRQVARGQRDDDAVARRAAKTRILEKRAIWSTPALVRESDAKIIPASSDMATQ